MRIEKKLNIRLALEDITYLESEADLETSIQSEPDRNTYRSVIDAIKKFLGMNPRELYQFATEGGTIEEDVIFIESLQPRLILEQQVYRVVQTGNYAKVLEIRMPGQGFTYKGFMVVKLSMPNDEVEKALQARMAGWQPGQPVPFKWYKTEAEALKAMSDAEAKAAGQSPTPAKPIKQKVTKTPVNKLAAKMAEQMGDQEAAQELVKANPANIIHYADLGMKDQKASDTWKTAKTIFLAWLALSALVTGAAGLAALVIGYLAVKGYEASKRIKEDLDDKDVFRTNCPECNDNIIVSPEFHAAHTAATTEAVKRGLETNETRYSRIRRAWGVDPEEWMACWDEVMRQHGFERDMSRSRIHWIPIGFELPPE